MKLLSLRKRNKKASLLDWFFIVVILFVAAIVLVVSLFIGNKVNDTGIFSDNTDAQYALDSSRSTLINMDNMMVFIVVGLSIFTICSAAMVWNHPAFFFVNCQDSFAIPSNVIHFDVLSRKVVRFFP